MTRGTGEPVTRAGEPGGNTERLEPRPEQRSWGAGENGGHGDVEIGRTEGTRVDWLITALEPSPQFLRVHFNVAEDLA